MSSPWKDGAGADSRVGSRAGSRSRSCPSDAHEKGHPEETRGDRRHCGENKGAQRESFCLTVTRRWRSGKSCGEAQWHCCPPAAWKARSRGCPAHGRAELLLRQLSYRRGQVHGPVSSPGAAWQFHVKGSVLHRHTCLKISSLNSSVFELMWQREGFPVSQC